MNAIKNILFAVKKAFHILPSKKEKRMVFGLWSLTVLSYIISMFLPTIQMWITDGAISVVSGSNNYFLLLAGFLGLVISLLLEFCSRKKFFAWSDYVSTTISNSIYSELLKKSTRIKYSNFDKKDVYEKITQTSNNIPERIASLITWNTIPPFIGGLISLIFVSITLFYVHWSVAILVAVGNIASIYFYYRRMKNNYFLQIEQIPQKRWANTYWSTLTDKNALKEIFVFGLFDFLVEKWKLYSIQTANQNFRFSVKYSTIMLLSDIAVIFFKMMALGVAIYEIIKGQASIGTFMLVYGSINVFNGYLSDISRAFINVSENSLYIEDWIKFMDLEEEYTSENKTEDFGEINIEFSDIYFQYSDTDRFALNGLSVKINQGERIAIVGENGSGKSTFVSLLTGLYDNYIGKISINGKDVCENLSALRNHITVMFQDFGRYEFTVKDNILLGNLDKEVSDSDIYEAAEKADAIKLIDSLQNNLDTNIGSFLDNGIYLSGGQWQKIALSRTFLNKDAKVVILDEPTAALDPFSESAIYKRFLEKIDNQTAILISHRLGATKFADRILVFEDGKIVEDGSHEELMKNKSVYWDMYTAQSKLYMEVK